MFPRLSGKLTPWMRCTLRHDEVLKRATAKENVYSDSVLGLGKVQDPSEGNAKWKDQFQYFKRSNEYIELFGFDGEQIEYVKHRLRHDESSSDISMNSENIHISMWPRFIASSMQAELHMDPSCEKNLGLFKNSELESIEGLFEITRMMIEGNSEMKNVFTADGASSLWENPYCSKNKQ